MMISKKICRLSYNSEIYKCHLYMAGRIIKIDDIREYLEYQMLKNYIDFGQAK
jgi:hypothetical protein